MMRYLSIICLICLLACSTSLKTFSQSKPKLVVGIVIDQMRYDYVQRFGHHFGENGFNRFYNEGFVLRNAHYNYIPTNTGPGHASIFTGTTPSNHGIISNGWYDRNVKRGINCVEDTTVTLIGSNGSKGYSPVNLLATTIGDELKLSSNYRSKSIGVSIKNRGAILPVGHSADGAYWYDGNTGNFVTSSYYMHELPGWLMEFNNKGLADQYLSQNWNKILPEEQYTASGADESEYESKISGRSNTSFPYDLKKLRSESGYWLLPSTPFGNSYILEMAKAALEGERLGQDENTDLLAIGLSSTDYIGHAFGPSSIEVEDTYIRLDRDLANFFDYLDQQIGRDQYLVFLSSDHGVVEIPNKLMENKIAAGYFMPQELIKQLTAHLTTKYGFENMIESLSNGQIYLNKELIVEHDLNLLEIENRVAEFLRGTGFARVYTGHQIMESDINEGGIKGSLNRGYNQQRSGDVVAILNPNWLMSDPGGTGTSHGSGYNYDTHVPILFWGQGIKRGDTVKKYHITDIAPTISLLLNISFPNASTGVPILELFE